MHISLQAEVLGEVFGLPITNSLALSVLTAVLLVGGGFLVAQGLKLVPGKVQSTAELVVDSLLDLTAQVVGDRKQASRFFPLVATIFLFILLNNWIGVLPGTGSIGFFEPPSPEATASQGKTFVPFFRSANSDLNTTLALALIAMTAIQLYGIQKLGFFRHFSRFFTVTKGPLHFFVGILEFIGELAKILSFSFRLFGNVFAGEVLLIIVMTLVPVVVPLPFIFLEFFVGFIQALVFAMLTLIFLKVATTQVEH